MGRDLECFGCTGSDRVTGDLLSRWSLRLSAELSSVLIWRIEIPDWGEAVPRDRNLNVRQSPPVAHWSAVMRLAESTVNPISRWEFAAGPTEWSL